MASTQTAIVLPPLPYERDALEPHMSRETLDYHYGKHHKAYVEKTNALKVGTQFEDASLEEMVLESSGELFNNAAQVWNHNFFWQCLTPKARPPGSAVLKALESLGGLEELKGKFDKAAVGLFGSGWTWLVTDAGGAVKLVTSSNGNNPMREGQTPILTCDVWEHAYYIDHRNDRAAYLKDYWALVNWEFVAKNLAQR
jgi:superoxide dismutase, Fe-Mn family